MAKPQASNKKTAAKTVAIGKKPSGKWNINIRVAENGYIVEVYEVTNEYPSKSMTFIAASEKELAAIVDKYK